MAGGAYLCFEGFEKVAHKLLRSQAEVQAEYDRLVQALGDPAVDFVVLEREKIKGAVRTDFVLSIEIIVITLGTVQTSPLWTQLSVLSGVAVLMTLGVYGLVAGIVKIDDVGLYFSQKKTGVMASVQRMVGRALLWFAPALMKSLSVLGTVAMFLVGGGILAHGVPELGHAIAQFSAMAGRLAAPVIEIGLHTLLGVLAGVLSLLGVTVVKRLKKC